MEVTPENTAATETTPSNRDATTTPPTRSLTGASFDHEYEDGDDLFVSPVANLTSQAGRVSVGSDQGAESGHQELPQIVWLRGDEPWAGDFSMDADAVMAQLGIKRSRLTQISGKELRVGRMRVDRYVRPMYRAEDVETYKQWSRATATHQRSSLVLKEAAARLEEQGGVIEEKIRIASRDWVETLQGDVSNLTSAVHAIPQEIGSKWSGDLQALASRLEESLAAFERRNQEALEQWQTDGRELLGQVAADVAKVLTEVETATGQVNSEQAAAETFRKEMRDLQTKVAGDIADLSDRLTVVTRRQDEVGTNAQAAFAGLAEALTLIIHHQKDQAAKADALMQKRLADVTIALQSVYASNPSGATRTVTQEMDDEGGRTLIRTARLRKAARQGTPQPH